MLGTPSQRHVCFKSEPCQGNDTAISTSKSKRKALDIGAGQTTLHLSVHQGEVLGLTCQNFHSNLEEMKKGSLVY